MGFFGKLFGSEKALDTIVDSAVSGLDKLVYTSEEKAEDHAKAVTEARSMVVKWMAATQGQNLARRLIALTVTAIWVGQYAASTALSIAAVWLEPAMALKVQTSANIINGSAHQMNGAMMLILGFYFAAMHMDKIVGVAMGKFGGPK